MHVTNTTVRLCCSLIPNESFSSQNLVCFHADSAGRGLSTSSPAPSQTLWILRCPVRPLAAHSGEKNQGIISSATQRYCCLCNIIYLTQYLNGTHINANVYLFYQRNGNIFIRQFVFPPGIIGQIQDSPVSLDLTVHSGSGC